MRSAREEASELLFALWSAPRELLPSPGVFPVIALSATKTVIPIPSPWM